MSDVVYFLLTVAVGAGGGLLARRLKVPAGAMVGSMLGVAVFSVLSGHGLFPDQIRPFVQMCSGAVIGIGITRADILGLKKMLLPMIILILGLIFLNMSFGLGIHYLGGLDIVTSLFASSPGGASDMSLIADELGANAVEVAILQLTRLLGIYIIFPPVFKKLLTGKGKKSASGRPEQRRRHRGFIPGGIGSFGGQSVSAMPIAEERPATAAVKVQAASPLTTGGGEERAADAAGPGTAAAAITLPDVEENQSPALDQTPETKEPPRPRDWQKQFALTMLTAFAGGILGYLLKIPAGAMIGAMIGAAAFRVISLKGYTPPALQVFAQIGAGCLIGSQMTRESFFALGELIIPAIIMIVGMVILTFSIGYIMHKITRIPLVTCLLACTPGGIQEMTLLSHDLGADTPKVAILQMARLMVVIALFPTLLKMVALSGWFG